LVRDMAVLPQKDFGQKRPAPRDQPAKANHLCQSESIQVTA
jgi:hypothetical protein